MVPGIGCICAMKGKNPAPATLQFLSPTFANQLGSTWVMMRF